MTPFWKLWMEAAWAMMESSIGSFQPMQLLNALVVTGLVAPYIVGRKSKIGKLLALWAAGAESIVLWVTCTIVLRRWGM